jgi:hypothetical protein
VALVLADVNEQPRSLMQRSGFIADHGESHTPELAHVVGNLGAALALVQALADETRAQATGAIGAELAPAQGPAQPGP